jgi:hypothetical protein
MGSAFIPTVTFYWPQAFIAHCARQTNRADTALPQPPGWPSRCLPEPRQPPTRCRVRAPMSWSLAELAGRQPARTQAAALRPAGTGRSPTASPVMQPRAHTHTHSALLPRQDDQSTPPLRCGAQQRTACAHKQSRCVAMHLGHGKVPRRLPGTRASRDVAPPPQQQSDYSRMTLVSCSMQSRPA